MNDTVTAAKAEFVRAKDRLTHALAVTPDDKINWAPSASARTPIHLVAHAAMGNALMLDLHHGKPFPYAGPVEYDAACRESEKEYTARAQAVGLLEQTSAEYLAWLDTLTPEQLASTIQTAFGPFEVATSITLAADHIRNHAAQIDYLQTIWGDTDWHM